MQDRDGARPNLAELFLLDRLPALARIGTIVAAVGVAVAWGFVALGLHLRELALRAQDLPLNPVANLFADGSSARTLWPGWVAAAIFALSALRQRHAPLEPPAGSRVSTRGVAGLRAGLRREYVAARCVLVALALLALGDAARLAVSGAARLLGVKDAGGDILWEGLEFAGLVAACLALATWVAGFHTQLDRLGALRGPPSAPGSGHRQMAPGP